MRGFGHRRQWPRLRLRQQSTPGWARRRSIRLERVAACGSGMVVRCRWRCRPTRIPAVPAEGALTFAADQAIPLARGDLGLLLHPVPHRGLGEIEALGDLTGRAVTLPA